MTVIRDSCGREDFRPNCRGLSHVNEPCDRLPLKGEVGDPGLRPGSRMGSIAVFRYVARPPLDRLRKAKPIDLPLSGPFQGEVLTASAAPDSLILRKRVRWPSNAADQVLDLHRVRAEIGRHLVEIRIGDLLEARLVDIAHNLHPDPLEL